MKSMSLILVFLFFPTPAICTIQDQDATVIDTYIARQARRERGEEYKDARKVIVGNLNNDDSPETVVLYTIESQGGTNNYVQYIAVFVRRNGKLAPLTRAAVGGKSRRSVELISIDHKTIQLETLDYGPNDASCCPSIRGRTQYVLVRGILRELKSRN